MKEFEIIYKTYFNDVFRYIRRLSGDEKIAEEVTGETFFKAIQAIDKFKGECDLRIWLCQIAKNTYYTYLKKSKRLKSIDEMDVSDGESLEERLIWSEEAKKIKQALHTLPDPYKEVFTWRVYAELSFKEIGQIFHKTENWACVTYHRARKKIIEQLEGNKDEEL
ncbi:MAG: sigma-70 family RNA polymerase sigma factor [Clostridia bacterium]|nr:sigma-70 family RNA polymerase sigma factor [Clostridia bacterium]